MRSPRKITSQNVDNAAGSRGGSRVLRIVTWAVFILYLLSLFVLLFVPIGFGRQSMFGLGIFQLGWDEYGSYLADHFRTRSNFVPFDSITGYLGAIGSGYPAVQQNGLMNFLGNLVAFVPMGAILPVLFEKQRRFGRFIVTILLVLIVVESVQVIAMVGSCDIDDIILNAAGAILAWWVLKIPPINRIVQKFNRV